MSIRAVVTDIEGTTTDIAFVHDLLFPYSVRALPDFVRAHATEPAVAEALEDARGVLGAPDADLELVIMQLLEWIARDQKVTPLKALQGMVWRAGYESGDFTGHVYPDAAAALRAWRDRGIDLYLYSSGSVDAQKLLFGHSDAGDLTPLFRGYFDTRVGRKKAAASYRAIVQSIGVPAENALFLSDVVAELDAAEAAGMQTCLLVREAGLTVNSRHPVARDFTEVQPLFG
jgi:enolase-phosphatase E1